MSLETQFAVTLIRRSIPTTELLADLRRVAQTLNTDRLSAHQYNQLGHFNATTVIHRFGSWTIALKRVGLRPRHHFDVTDRQALDDLKRVARDLKTASPTVTAYAQHGRFTPHTLRKKFGAWHRVLQAAELVPRYYRSLTKQELFDNLKKVWEDLGHQPRNRDMRPPNSLYTVGPYLKRFGNWSKTLCAFEAFMHPDLPPRPLPARRKYRVNTHINWQLRCQILQRDHFRCQACGRSPATDDQVTLQIDHIHPRSRGGMSTAENLQTLCNQCNIGKGNT